EPKGVDNELPQRVRRGAGGAVLARSDRRRCNHCYIIATAARRRRSIRAGTPKRIAAAVGGSRTMAMKVEKIQRGVGGEGRTAGGRKTFRWCCCRGSCLFTTSISRRVADDRDGVAFSPLVPR